MYAIDIYSDPNQETLVKIAQELPGTIDRISMVGEIELDDRDDLSENAFAWPEEKMYPIYTKEAALLSSVYLEAADVPEHVKTNCEEACRAFDFGVEIGRLEKTASEESLDPSDYVLPNREKLPIVDAETYATSERLFLDNLDDFSFDEMVVGARQLVKKASDMNIDSNSDLSRIALTGQLNVDKARALSMDRYSETADPSYLSVAESLSGRSYSSIEKIAEWVVDMNDLDDTNGIHSSTLFSAMDPLEKQAAIILGNEEVSFEKIAQIEYSDWLEVMDSEIVDYLYEDETLSLEKVAEIIDDCSNEEYDIIESFIKTQIRN